MYLHNYTWNIYKGLFYESRKSMSLVLYKVNSYLKVWYIVGNSYYSGSWINSTVTTKIHNIVGRSLLKESLLRTLPPLDLLYDDCTQNRTVLKYMSYGVNFWQKSLVYQEGISRIILWNFLFLANCIVRNQQL